LKGFPDNAIRNVDSRIDGFISNAMNSFAAVDQGIRDFATFCSWLCVEFSANGSAGG
jgi:hypothetical protein